MVCLRYGGMDIKEAHALADILCHVNEVFQIEESSEHILF